MVMRAIGAVLAAVPLGGFAVPPAAEDAAKPLIKIVVKGGTITKSIQGTVHFDTPIQQFIEEIRRNYPESRRVLDSVRLESVTLKSFGSGLGIGQDYLEVARTVSRLIQEPDVRGVIVTEGTTTSDETAYFLHLLVRSEKPVVVTNSQRQHGTIGNDGDKNFVDAVSVVLSGDTVGKGAMIVHNETISSAREVQKTNGRPGAFVSGEHGILGLISEYEGERGITDVVFYRAPTRRHTFRSEFDIDAITSLPKVEIVSAYYDADPALIRAAVAAGAKGIVISGRDPNGSANGTQLAALEEMIKKGIPVVLSSRLGINNRIPLNTRNKFIKGDNLVPHKARILLQLALTKTSDFSEIQRIFNEY